MDCSPSIVAVFSDHGDARKLVLKDLIKSRARHMEHSPKGAWRQQFQKHEITGSFIWNTYTVFEIGHEMDGDELYDETWVIDEWEVL